MLAKWMILSSILQLSYTKSDLDGFPGPLGDGSAGGNIDELIDEDLSNIDLTGLPLEFSEEEVDPDCEDLKLQVNGYRYDTKTKSGEDASVIITQKTILDDTQNTAWTRDGKVDGVLRTNKHLNCYDQESQNVIDHIKNNLLVPANGKDLKLANPIEENIDGEVGQPIDVDRIVFGGELKHGFFIEAGSYDGEFNSDSLYFEMKHGWTGLLVEPHPYVFNDVLTRNRNATHIQTCLATEKKPHMVKFDYLGSVRNHTHREGMMGITVDPIDEHHVEMQCLPIFSILMAMGNPTVNHFSLDVEGAEFAILKTIPWDKVDIQVLSIESHLLNRIFPGTREEMISYLDSVGYNHIPWGHTSTNPNRANMGTSDDMFVRKDIPLKLTKEEKENMYKEEGKVWEDKDAQKQIYAKVKDEFTYKRSDYFIDNKVRDEL